MAETDSLGPLPHLTTPRFVLRDLSVDDAEDLFAVHSDAEVMRFFGAAPRTRVAEAAAWILGYCEDDESFRWGIVPRATITPKAPRGRVIGTCGLHAWETVHQRIELGYELSRAHWRQGVMSEVLPGVVAAAFGALPVNRVQALVEPENVASSRLLEKVGFAREGLLRGYERMGGRYFDLLMFARLRSDVDGG